MRSFTKAVLIPTAKVMVVTIVAQYVANRWINV